jgi:hypothetical protein
MDVDEYLQDFNNDCSKYNFRYIPPTIEPTSRTIAIGDIHGDLKLAIQFLIVAKCIEKCSSSEKNYTTVDVNGTCEHYKWIGNDTIVVQVGDQVDRCRTTDFNDCKYPQTTTNDEASDIKILKFYTEIDKLAINDGNCGRLINLLGNHELMNVMGKLNYVSFMGLLEFTNIVDMSKIKIDDYLNMNKLELNNLVDLGNINRKKAFSNKFKGNREEALNEFLACSRTSAVIVGDLLFVHGGMIKTMAKAYNIEHLNQIVRKWLLGKFNDETSNKLLLYSNMEKKRLNETGNGSSFTVGDRIFQIIKSKNSIFWNRVLGYLKSDKEYENENDTVKKSVKDKCDFILNEVFHTYEINGIVIGHTPQMSEKNNGINSACNKKVWRVDIGASSAFDIFRQTKRKVQVLEIKYGDEKQPKFNILE